MNKKYLLPFLLVIFTLSCNRSSNLAYSYQKKNQEKISYYKKNKKYTYLERGEPKRDYVSVKKFIAEIKEYSFKKEVFQNEEAIFVLNGINTYNFAELNKIENGVSIAIDSTVCKALEFLFLTLSPVETGEYLVVSSGCHHYKKIRIKIE